MKYFVPVLLINFTLQSCGGTSNSRESRQDVYAKTEANYDFKESSQGYAKGSAKKEYYDLSTNDKSQQIAPSDPVPLEKSLSK